jgi:hypothetical protein
MFFLSSFDANISYDDILQSAQAAELQYRSSGKTLKTDGIIANEKIEDADQDQVNEDEEEGEPSKKRKINPNDIRLYYSKIF